MEDDFLKVQWEKLTDNLSVVNVNFYQKLVQLYSQKNRHYHNLNHIQALLKLSEEYRNILNSPRTINFAIWYHDAIYNASKNNNEEKSAELAKKHLTAMGVNQNVISDCFKLIIATKKHEVPNNLNTFDAKFLLDIDLSILAAPQKAYLQYTKQIRKEYSIYTDLMYNKGRKKSLTVFFRY